MDKETKGKAIASALYTALVAIITMLIALFFGSCRSVRTIEKEVIKTDTVVMNKIQIDSIYVNDSIYIRELIAGDTIKITTDRWHTRWRDRILYDSIYIAQRDTVTVTTTKEVPRKLSGWQWFQIWAGRLALLALAVVASIFVVKRKLFDIHRFFS